MHHSDNVKFSWIWMRGLTVLNKYYDVEHIVKETITLEVWEKNQLKL